MTFRRYPHLLATLCGSLTLTFGAQANAQTESQAIGLEEIVVTAQKREQNVQDVPIAIDALSRDKIIAQRITGPDDLVKQLPNLSLKTASAVNSGFAIRGVGTNNFHLTAQQAVGLYFDEVSQVTPFTSQLGLFDMERIEVLRGPQNTLFGRNTTGGAVNFITRRPNPADETNGYINVNAGNFGRLDGEGAVGFALGEHFAVRLAAQLQNRDGVFTDVESGEKIGSTERQSARLGLAWMPSDDTEAWLSVHYGKSDPERVPRKATGRFLADNVTTCPNNDDGAPQFEGTSDCFARNKTGVPFNPSLPGWRDAHDAAGNTARVELSGALLRFEHDFGGVTLASLTGYDNVEQHLADESGGLPYIQFQAQQQGDYQVFSQELRLTSSGEGKVNWIGGLFYSHENDHFSTTARNNAVGPPTLSVVPTSIMNQQGDVYSAYGQIDWAFTDRFNMNLGLRYTNRQEDRRYHRRRDVRHRYRPRHGHAPARGLCLQPRFRAGTRGRFSDAVCAGCGSVLRAMEGSGAGLQQDRRQDRLRLPLQRRHDGVCQLLDRLQVGSIRRSRAGCVARHRRLSGGARGTRGL